MAAQNQYLQEASKSIFQFSTDEQIRKMCRDRIEYYQDIHNYQRFIAQQEKNIAEKDNTIAILNSQIEILTDEIENLKF